MIRHLVTRPLEDHEPFVSDLRAMGREIVSGPVFEIVYFKDKEICLADVQALLITSANGVRALVQSNISYDGPVYCVGDSSAEAARQAGFEKVFSAGGDVTDLADLVMSELRSNAGVLFHPAASKLAGNLGSILEVGGYQYQREVLYEAKAFESYSHEIINLFKMNKINEMSFFSPRSSKVFVRLVKRSDLENQIAGVKALCLSKAVANSLETLSGLEIVIADQPTRVSMNQAIADSK